MGNKAQSQLTGWLHDIDAATGQYDLFRLLKKVTLSNEFSHFCVIKLPVTEDDTLKDLSIISNWPPELIHEYEQRRLLEINPFIRLLKSSNKPIVWDLEEVASKRADAGRASFVDLFSDFGFLGGIYFPCAASNGTRGSVSFVANSKEQVSEDAIADLALTASLVFDQLVKFEEALTGTGVELSEREQQCLQLMAGGLATGRIASELNISEHTVNHHIGLLSQKLRARNRAHAISLAFRLKILK